MILACQNCNSLFTDAWDKCPTCTGTVVTIVPKDRAEIVQALLAPMRQENERLAKDLAEARGTLVYIAKTRHNHSPDETLSERTPCVACMAVKTLGMIVTPASALPSVG